MTRPRAPLPGADDELWSLVEALVAGTATMAERDRLDARLRGEPQARLFYVTYLDLHAHLQWRTRGGSVPVQGVRRRSAGGRRARRPRRFLSPSRLLVAASLALAAGLLWAVLPHRHGPEEGEARSFRTRRPRPWPC
jgi:hypothetical protein